MILSILSDEHLTLVTWLSIDLILFLGEIIDFNLKDKSRTYVLWKLYQGFSFWEVECSSKFPFLSFYFFVGILTSNDALIEVPKFN